MKRKSSKRHNKRKTSKRRINKQKRHVKYLLKGGSARPDEPFLANKYRGIEEYNEMLVEERDKCKAELEECNRVAAAPE